MSTVENRETQLQGRMMAAEEALAKAANHLDEVVPELTVEQKLSIMKTLLEVKWALVGG